MIDTIELFDTWADCYVLFGLYRNVSRITEISSYGFRISLYLYIFSNQRSNHFSTCFIMSIFFDIEKIWKNYKLGCKEMESWYINFEIWKRRLFLFKFYMASWRIHLIINEILMNFNSIFIGFRWTNSFNHIICISHRKVYVVNKLLKFISDSPKL